MPRGWSRSTPARPRPTTISAAGCCWAARRCTGRSPCRKAACGSIWAAGRGELGTDRRADLHKARKVYLVDLCDSLLAVARKRCEARGWKNVEAVSADATTFRPAAGAADVVTFSYSLTMIPDWFAAIDNALAMLRPGGTIGVTDFFVARKYPAEGRGAARLVHADLLARLVRLGQRLPVAGPRSLFAAELPHGAVGREAGEGALHSADPRAVLYVHRAEGTLAG